MQEAMIRVGFGYDSHRFSEGEFIMLAGIKIPYDKGIASHSDGDVLLHALCDAILGATAMGDIGQHFPDHLEENKNAPSERFVREIVSSASNYGFKVNNIDATVITEKPKLADYMLPMRERIAELCHIPLANVNIKAKTNEKMGWIGSGEGLAAYCVVTVRATS